MDGSRFMGAFATCSGPADVEGVELTVGVELGVWWHRDRVLTVSADVLFTVFLRMGTGLTLGGGVAFTGCIKMERGGCGDTEGEWEWW